MSTLLFEIGTEELPAGFILPALKQMKAGFSQKAKETHIAHGEISIMGTPRRLVMRVEELALKQNDRVEEFMGPSTKAGIGADGSYTRAAIGFARSKGASVDDLTVVDTKKGEYLMLVREVAGMKTSSLLPDILLEILKGFSFPKSMRWGSGSTAFARPVKWLLALCDNEVISFEYAGVVTGNSTYGHRFLHNREIVVETASVYDEKIRNGGVIVSYEERRKATLASVREAVQENGSIAHAQVLVDETLLDTVTNLVENPQGVCGTFDEKFLDLPDEVLITSMREHQKYFPLVDRAGSLQAGFVAVNNTVMDDVTLTRKGHQRVLRARLEDALFFYMSDKKKPLEDYVSALDGIIFQAKLGTMQEKNQRIVSLAEFLSEKLAPECKEDAIRAATLCKADLLTEMVGEFPTLQGVMGESYARAAGENDVVSAAIREHYMPKRAGAQSPASKVGAIVGLADRVDTIAGCFAIGQKPTGTADPFGLRRLALTSLQLIRDFHFQLSLRALFQEALGLYHFENTETVVAAILSFIEGRYTNDYVSKNGDAEAVLAATSVRFDEVNDCTLRVEALSEIKKDAAFSVLAASYKRIRNIIKENVSTDVDVKLFKHSEENELFRCLTEVEERFTPLLMKKLYLDALKILLVIKDPIDHFFDKVMVMDEDPAIRQNRLNLLTRVGTLVLQIGDISKMHEE